MRTQAGGRDWCETGGVSTTETHPTERVLCGGPTDPAGSGPPAAAEGIELLQPREVPLGGPRAMLVRRVLPGRDRRMVGAWCFADTYGPEVTRMVVPPHPHTGLQTVSWLVEGSVRHRDSLGSDTLVRPGELHLMTAGRGVAHSEVSPSRGPLHGAQLWVALPSPARDGAPAFESHTAPARVDLAGARVTVLLGELLGTRSPATTFTPIVGAEVDLDAGGSVTVPLRDDFEHGVLALTDGVEVGLAGASEGPAPVATGAMGYAGPGSGPLTVTAGSAPARALLLGGEPFTEDLVMWWNFVARSHDEVAEARATWERERDAAPDARRRFGLVGGEDATLAAPELPNATLRPRPRHRER